jgi:hypothetical protein
MSVETNEMNDCNILAIHYHYDPFTTIGAVEGVLDIVVAGFVYSRLRNGPAKRGIFENRDQIMRLAEHTEIVSLWNPAIDVPFLRDYGMDFAEKRIVDLSDLVHTYYMGGVEFADVCLDFCISTSNLATAKIIMTRNFTYKKKVGEITRKGYEYGE